MTKAPFMLISIVSPTNSVPLALIRTLACTGVRRKRRFSDCYRSWFQTTLDLIKAGSEPGVRETS